MEIKLKENSDLVVKNHSGDVLCSIDEATGNVTGGGTKLYRHHLNINNYAVWLDVISTDSTPITSSNAYSKILLGIKYSLPVGLAAPITARGLAGSKVILVVFNDTDSIDMQQMTVWESGWSVVDTVTLL